MTTLTHAFRRSASVLFLLSLLWVVPALTASGLARQASNGSASVTPIPAAVTANWEKLVGVWVADNSAFKNEQDTFDAYGIEWNWGLGKKSLIGRLYGIKDGKDVGTFWQFREYWHPGEGKVYATQFGGNGTFGIGPHEIKPDGTSEMVQTFYDPDSRTASKVGHRSTLEGDVHTTASFGVDDSGTWTPRRTYVWHRQR